MSQVSAEAGAAAARHATIAASDDDVFSFMAKPIHIPVGIQGFGIDMTRFVPECFSYSCAFIADKP
jgi:hypothetical protein